VNIVAKLKTAVGLHFSW